jgi:serine/threonine protein kinase/WD40 repeat protein
VDECELLQYLRQLSSHCPSEQLMDTFARALSNRYRLERELGVGGMARVYLAHDLRHNRKVALKVLRPELAANVGVQRFLNEIRTAANLQHPHILPLHDSGEVDGVAFYVMPFVAGESLRSLLLRESQLSIEQTLAIATDVASALDHAHRRGIIHRDIKPENILLQDSRAIVADFGIALALSLTGDERRLTASGVALGTPQYMAPEQATATHQITAKVDIYALGCMTYEMLIGEPPFVGTSAQAVVARMLAEDPRPLVTQRRTVPPHVEAAVLRALAKVPADRFSDAAEFARALTTPTQVRSPVQARQRWFTPTRTVAAAIALATVGLISVSLLDSPDPVSTRYALALSASQAPDPNFPIRVSPDGFHLLFAARAGENSSPQLWIKARDRFEARPLEGTIGVGSFVFSPDGRSIAFVQDRRLKQLSLSGGPSVVVGDSAAPMPWRGIAWLDDGSIVYVHEDNQQLWRISAAGVRTKFFQLDSGFVTHLVALPNSRGVLFVRCHGSTCENEQDLWVVRLSNGVGARLEEDVARAVYAPTGHLLMLRRDGFLQAAAFDLRRLNIKSTPVSVLDSIAVRGERATFDISQSGTLVIRSGPSAPVAPQFQMVWVNRSGRESPIDSGWTVRFSSVSPGGSEGGWSLSPDGRRLAVGLRTSSGDDLWIKDLPDGPLSRVTFSKRPHFRPRWTPDGRSLSFISLAHGRMAAFEVSADGSGQERVIFEHDSNVAECAISKDGRWIVARVGFGGSTFNRDILAKPRNSGDAVRDLIATPFVETAFSLSPDGRWIAYQSDETGRLEVYVRSFPETRSYKRQVSGSGGYSPLWSRDGRELFYMTSGGTMTAVRVLDRGIIGGTRPLFDRGAALYGGPSDAYTPWDVSLDGQRFVMAKRVQTANLVAGLVLVTDNWFGELRRVVGSH